VQDNLSPSLIAPPSYTPEVNMLPRSRRALYAMLATGDSAKTLMDATFLAIFAGGLGTLLWLGRLCLDPEVAYWINAWARTLDKIYDAYKFFPAFLLLGHTSYAVGRWRDFLVNSHTVQARLHDIAVMVGGTISTPVNKPVRQKLFKLYRYLNLAHGITYQNVSPCLPQTLDGFIDLGLATPNEVRVLAPLEFKARDIVVAWIAQQIEDLVRDGQIREMAINPESVQGLRGILARHHDLFVRNNPNTYWALMRQVTDYIVLLTVLGFPFMLNEVGTVADHTAAQALQPWVIVGVFLIVSAFTSSMRMCQILDQPFDTEDDSYNCDALLASTDRVTFSALRALFDVNVRDQPDDTAQGDTKLDGIKSCPTIGGEGNASTAAGGPLWPSCFDLSSRVAT